MVSEDALKSFGALMPQEERLAVDKMKSHLFIGIPKETTLHENRVALTPEAVALLVNNGHRVVVQAGAGGASSFTDHEFSESGAEIVSGAKKVFEADILVKVAPLSNKEVDMAKERQTIMSALQMPQQPKETLMKLMARKVTALAWDYIKDEEGIFPVVRAMGEIAGTTSILVAAELLSNSSKGLGDMLGGISGVAPTEVVIIGAGTVGEYAARAALGLGASVKIFDNHTYRLSRIQNDIGIRLFTSTLQPKVLLKALKRADVAVGAIRAPHGRTPCIVTESMVEEMKPGSVIIDVSIDQGGCFETSHITTHSDPVFTYDDVRHYCVPNMASKVSRTASKALSNIVAPILLNIADEGGMESVLHQHPGMRNGVYVYHGTLTNRYLGEHFDIPHQSIDLLLAAF